MSSVEILQNLSDLLVTNNIFKDFLRQLGWELVMFLKTLIDIIDTVVKNTYKIGNKATDNYSNNINSYKSNIPDELDFNEALNNHDKQTYNKRMNLNADRRQ